MWRTSDVSPVLFILFLKSFDAEKRKQGIDVRERRQRRYHSQPLEVKKKPDPHQEGKA